MAAFFDNSGILFFIFVFYFDDQIWVMLPGHNFPGFSIMNRIKDDGKIVVFRVKPVCRYIKFQPFIVYQMLFLLYLYPDFALFIGLPVYNSDVFLRINYNTVTDIENSGFRISLCSLNFLFYNSFLNRFIPARIIYLLY